MNYYDAKTMISAPLCFYYCSSKQKHRLINADRFNGHYRA